MEVNRQEYPNLLTSLQPGQAVNVLSDRVNSIRKVNTDIADWLAERRKVEEAYANGLRKLAKRPQPEGNTTLGVFQTPWQRLVSSVEEIAQSHEIFASKVDADVETPLRQWAIKNREMQSFGTSQGNLTSIAREIDSAQKRADKLRDKNKPDQAAQANGSIDGATSQWESQAPFVFEQLQTADEARLGFLREVLTLYQTHENDQVERSRSATEACLGSLLTVETADEIKTFAARTVSGRPSISSTPRSRRHSTAASNVPPLPPPPRLSEARAATRVPSSDRLRPVPEDSSSGGFKGLKRLGTVIGRRKSALPPSASPEKPKKSSRFAFRREDSNRSFQQVDSPPTTGHELTPVASREERPTTQPSPSQAMQEPMQPQSVQARQTDGDDITPAPLPTTNGRSTPQGSTMPVTETTPTTRTPAAEVPPYQVPAISEPPPRFDAISQAQQEAAAVNGENEDALRSLTIRDQPIPEDEGEARDAFDSMANQLRIQAQQSGLRPQSSMRGRRDVRNTIFIPSNEPINVANGHSPGLSPPAANAGVAATTAATGPITGSPIVKRSDTPGTIPEDRASDANSIHSSNTLSSVSPAFAHPDLHEPGLNASIVETVNTWFSDGAVSKSFAIGEVALAYNPIGDKDQSPNETIRLDNFPLLEKVAANPAFVTANARDKEENAGEYSLALSSITKPTPTIGFKYQLHLDPESQSIYSPIMFSPAWQVQEAQASVIIGYNLNPSFSLPPDVNILTLRNVVITVSIDTSSDTGKAINAMMSPTEGASFKRKSSTIVWRMAHMVVSTEPQRLLARFLTTGPAPKAGHVEAKWELPDATGSALGVSAMSGASADVDPFADESVAPTPTKIWTSIPVSRKLVTGRYSAS